MQLIHFFCQKNLKLHEKLTYFMKNRVCFFFFFFVEQCHRVRLETNSLNEKKNVQIKVQTVKHLGVYDLYACIYMRFVYVNVTLLRKKKKNNKNSP